MQVRSVMLPAIAVISLIALSAAQEKQEVPQKAAAGRLKAGNQTESRLDVKPVRRLTGFSDWVTSAAFSGDGALLATGTYEKITSQKECYIITMEFFNTNLN